MQKGRNLPVWMAKKNNSKDQGANNSFTVDQYFGNKNSNFTKQMSNNSGYLGYNGTIHYFKDFLDIAQAADDLLNWINKSSEDKIPIGFDMEWFFSYQTGPLKTALVQVCVQLDVCYLFQVWELKTLPRSLKLLLEHDKAMLHGVKVKNDIRKLRRDFPDIENNVEKMISNCLELGDYANQVLGVKQCWSMARLVRELLKTEINKDSSVRMSRWQQNLTLDQQMYAAIDVYASQLLYNKLKEIENKHLHAEIEQLENELFASFIKEDTELNVTQIVDNQLMTSFTKEPEDEGETEGNTTKDLELEYYRIQKILEENSIKV